ncbi:MAG: ATP phosphoribosyltransferase regulatory subunit [Brevinematia bacterium]
MKEFLKNAFQVRNDLIGAPNGFSFELTSKKQLIDKLFVIVKKYNFLEINTPLFDFFEVYERTLGSNVKELFIFKDNSDFIVPRYDITTQIVRFLAPRIKSLSPPIKISYYGDVFREPEFKWHPRQIKQFGIEIIGGEGNPSEMITVLKEILETLEEFKTLKNYKIVFNFSQVIEAIISRINIEDQEILKHLISNKDIPSIKSIISDTKFIEDIEKLIYLSFNEDFDKIISEINKTLNIPISKEMEKELKTIVDNFNGAIWDPTLVSEMDYYSSFFLKVFAENKPYPVASGGRYDRLTKKFGYNETAMGFAIDII